MPVWARGGVRFGGRATAGSSPLDIATISPSEMQKLPTKLEGRLLVAPVVHGDERGLFLELVRVRGCDL